MRQHAVAWKQNNVTLLECSALFAALWAQNRLSELFRKVLVLSWSPVFRQPLIFHIGWDSSFASLLTENGGGACSVLIMAFIRRKLSYQRRKSPFLHRLDAEFRSVISFLFCLINLCVTWSYLDSKLMAWLYGWLPAWLRLKHPNPDEVFL